MYPCVAMFDPLLLIARGHRVVTVLGSSGRANKYMDIYLRMSPLGVELRRDRECELTRSRKWPRRSPLLISSGSQGWFVS